MICEFYGLDLIQLLLPLIHPNNHGLLLVIQSIILKNMMPCNRSLLLLKIVKYRIRN